MPNNKALFLFLTAMGLVLLALVFREAALLLLAFPFLTMLLVGFLRSPGKIELQAARQVSRAISIAGEPLDMTVRVDNLDHAEIFLSLEDETMPSMQVTEGGRQRHVLLPAGESTDLSYTFQAGRGVYAWKTIHITASDLFSLFEESQNLPAPGEVLIRPVPVRLRHIPLRPSITRHIPGSMPARLPGSGMNFFEVREYLPGDPLRKIHWRLTARHPGSLFTKEFEQDEIADIGLILDTREVEGDVRGQDSLFEKSVEAAAALAELFLGEGNRVGLLVFGEKTQTLFPSNGKKHLHQIYRALAQAAPRRSIPMEYLRYFSSRLFPRQSILFLISPLGPRDLSAYSRLATEEYQVILLSPSPLEQALRMQPADELHHLAYRAARLERVAEFHHLLEQGIQVIEWPIQQPLNDILQEKLSLVAAGHPRRVRA